MTTSAEPRASNGRTSGADVDVIVVGAGFAGLYMLHRLRQMGFSVRVLEAGRGVGGTWYWNRYPGARCDVESVEYSYQFSPELQQVWDWSERYAAQPEILRYAEHVADRFDLKRDIDFDTRVSAATFDKATSRWTIETENGKRYTAAFCVMATGCLSVPNKPKFKGTETFAGATYHTGTWPHEGVDFTGLRVGIIGTGSSAVQSIPIIAEQVQHLYVLQRTPSFVVPARNAPLDPREREAVKSEYPALRALAKTRRNGLFCATTDMSALAVSDEDRERAFRERYDRGGLCYTGTFNDLLINKRANEEAADFLRARIREVVKDPETAEALCPRTVVGGKRLCIDTGYYEAFNRDNVTLIDLNKAPLEEITKDGLIAGGKSYQLDAIVYAIGFDAMTGALTRIDIRGKGGETLAGKWAEGPRTYLGLCIAGFPEPLHHHRPRQPVGADQHAADHRAARRLDRRLHRPHARERPQADRRDAAGAGRLGRACERDRGRHALSDRQFLVSRRQHPRKAARVHALHRLSALRREMQRSRGKRLRGLRAELVQTNVPESHHHLIVITGGPGSGKTSLIDALKAAGFETTVEAGRAIIQDQAVIGGDALPWRDRSAFAEQMLAWEMRSYRAAQALAGPVFFDRGVPDVIGYLNLMRLPVPSHIEKAAELFRYRHRVFIAPPWREIFSQDAERHQDFAEAERTYDAMTKTYTRLGYMLVELPRASVAERVRFVLDDIARATTAPHPSR